MTEKEWMRAKKALAETIVIERVVVPLDANIASGNADFRSFQQKEEKGNMLKIKLRSETKKQSRRTHRRKGFCFEGKIFDRSVYSAEKTKTTF